MPKEHRNIEMPQGGNQFLASLFLSLPTPSHSLSVFLFGGFQSKSNSKNTGPAKILNKGGILHNDKRAEYAIETVRCVWT